MISAWTKHIADEEEKNKFKSSVLGSKIVLNRLSAILKEVEGDLNSTELNNKIYDVPNWDYRQAHLNGYREAVRTVQKIINLDPQDNK